MVIEELTLYVPSGRREVFLEADGRVWTRFLETCPGYLGKEVWLPADGDQADTEHAHAHASDTVVLVIRWASFADWQRVTADEVAEVDRRMGELRAEVRSCRAFTVAESPPDRTVT